MAGSSNSAVLCALLGVFLSYAHYAAVLRWLTLSLFAYVAVVFAVHVPWGERLARTVVPTIVLDGPHATALVAVLGTTISPYLSTARLFRNAGRVGADLGAISASAVI